MEAYLGTIVAWPINFAPHGWMFCQGQLLQISQYTALFALIGTTYGGDGRTTFALPDMRGRVPVGAGQEPGGANHSIGKSGGTESVYLMENQMPVHFHTSPASTQTATLGQPSPSAIPGSLKKKAGYPAIFIHPKPMQIQLSLLRDPLAAVKHTTVCSPI